jgi:hypothetical protein
VSDEPDNPIDKSNFATGEVWTRTIPIGGRRYHLLEAGMGNVTFIASKLPSYSLIWMFRRYVTPRSVAN